MPELIHPELSYTTRGILLQVYNTLGPMLPEKYYQDAVVLSAEKRGLTCEAEKAFEVFYRDEDERLPNFLRDKQPEFVWESRNVAQGLLYPDLVNAIQRACHRVHFALGAGFLHQVYRRATMIELRHSKLDYEYIKRLPIEYEGQLLKNQTI